METLMLDIEGPVPQGAQAAGLDLPVRVLHCDHGEALVELLPGVAPETAWRALLFAAWPIREVRAEGGGLEELYLSLTEPDAPRPGTGPAPATSAGGPREGAVA